MKVEQFLEQLGLTKNEVKIYLSLLELGSTSAGPLIKNLGMHRAAVYNLLDILIDKGLAHYVIQANRKYFEATQPKRLFELIETKKKKLEEQENLLKELLPQLEVKRSLSQESQEGTTYKGKKGLKSIFEDILNYESSEIQVIGVTGQFKETFNAYFTHWHKRRVNKNIKLKIIYSKQAKKLKREKELTLTKIKYIEDTNITPSTTILYSDKVAIVLWSKTPMAFLIRSKTVHESHKHFFNMLWNMK